MQWVQPERALRTDTGTDSGTKRAKEALPLKQTTKS